MNRTKLGRQISAIKKSIRFMTSTLVGFMIFGIAQTSSAESETLGYSTTPTFAGVTISNVSVNGGAITAPVEPGSTIDVTLDYNIFDDGCPGCIDQIQVGFTHSSPDDCIYSGIPGPSPGVSGTASFTITAPTFPGTYYLGFDRSQALSCPAGWWNGAPNTPNRWFAAITVN